MRDDDRVDETARDLMAALNNAKVGLLNVLMDRELARVKAALPKATELEAEELAGDFVFRVAKRVAEIHAGRGGRA